MSDFAARVDAFLGEYFALHPLTATSAGMHAHDGRWPDVSAAGRAGAARVLRSLDARVRGPSTTTGSRSTSGSIATSCSASSPRTASARRSSARTPGARSSGSTCSGDGLFTLIAREFAPLAERLASRRGARSRACPRCSTPPETLLGLRRPAGGPPPHREGDRAVGRASRTSIGDALAEGERAAAAGDAAVAAVLPRLRAARGRGAIRARRVRAAPARRRAAGVGRRGAPGQRAVRAEAGPHAPLDRAHAGGGPGPSPSASADAIRAEMVRIAREIWPGLAAATRPRPRTTPRRSGAVIDAIAVEHPAADDILDFCRAELGRIEAFCRERDVIGLADEPLDIRWTPVFLRSFGGAMLDSPGPLDRGQKAFFSVTPIPEEWTPEQAESYLREDNDRMLQLLTIHEAVPGHYLQGVYAQPRRRRCARTDLLERRLRRGLGGLRDPGDDGRRVRRERPGAAALPLEVLPAVRRERADRRRDPRRRT